MVKKEFGGNISAAAIAVVAVAIGCLGQAHAQRFQAVGNTNPTLRPPPDAKGWVIVTFEGTRAHMSFDLPGHIKLITENGIPYTNGATETYITEEGFHEGASYESWNDKDNRYSRMWIESQNEARIVVRHVCALVKGNKICHQEKPKVAPYGPGNWTDEWYVFHPDGTHIRRIKIWSAVAREAGRHGGATYPYELEGMYLWWGKPCRGMTASDHLEDGVLTLIKMDGAHKTVSLNPYPLGINEFRKMGRVYGDFRDANIHVVNTKSQYRPWRMGRWSRTLAVTPYVPVHRQVQLVPCFPPGTTRQSGYAVAGLGQMNWGEFWKVTDTSMSEIWLNGFTTNRQPAEELAALARSWLQAPEMQLLGQSGAKQYGYDVGDRAYLIDLESAKQPVVQVRLAASEDSPVVNPTFLINNWSRRFPQLKVNGEAVRRGTDFRAGSYKILELEDGRQWKDVLIVWVNTKSTKPIEFTIQPEGYRPPRTVVSSDNSEPKSSREPAASNEVAFRKWTSGNYSTQARLLTFADSIAVLEKSDGQTVRVPYAKLSPPDQKYLDDWKKQK